jgi:hypothetical protein
MKKMTYAMIPPPHASDLESEIRALANYGGGLRLMNPHNPFKEFGRLVQPWHLGSILDCRHSPRHLEIADRTVRIRHRLKDLIPLRDSMRRSHACAIAAQR